MASLAVGVPLVVGVVTTVLVLIWLPQIPNPAAIHWGFSGTPDGFAPRWVYPLMTAGLAGILPLVMGAAVVGSAWQTVYTTTIRMIVATAVGLSFFLGTILTGSVFVQRGVPSAEDAPGIAPLILMGLVVAIAFGVAVYSLMPASSQRSPGGEAVTPLKLNPGEVVVWTSSATGSLPFTVVVIGMCVVVAMLGVSGGPLYLLVVAALVAVLPLAFAMFHVSVGQRGLQVRSVLGWPRQRIGLSQVTSVKVGEVHPFQQWGGWGWRSNPQGTAVVTRKGPALQVGLANGRMFVVTCEDARRGAATLTALVEREREGRDAATS